MISVQWDRLYIVVCFFERVHFKSWLLPPLLFSFTINLIFSPSHPLKRTGRKIVKFNQILLSMGKMLPSVNGIGIAFCFALEADCWFEGFSVRDVNLERPVVPYPKALHGLGLPVLAWHGNIYFFVVHVDQFFEIILLFTHGWWC